MLGFDPGVDGAARPRCASAPTRTPRRRCSSSAPTADRLVVVSNWDASLHERLEETGLAPLVDGAIASAELGHAKPDGAIFAHALGLAGTPAAAALHAGDSPDADVEGALAAGLRAVLVARDGAARAPAGVPVVSSLAELPALCRLP